MGKLCDTVILYTANDSELRLYVFFEGEQFWLTKASIAKLLGTDRETIEERINEIFAANELNLDQVTNNFIVYGKEDMKKRVSERFYNMDLILAIGCRINIQAVTIFRKWTDEVMKGYLLNGYIKESDNSVNSYFDSLKDKIRSIRHSERKTFQKISDLFEHCSYDYDKCSDVTKKFYGFIQNKLHYAVTGRTAAEIISERVDSQSPTLGLNTWKSAPNGKIQKQDVMIAKNYLSDHELIRMNQLTNLFMDYAMIQAEDHVLMSMQAWIHEFNRFLENNRKRILHDKGDVDKKVALEKALVEYEIYHTKQNTTNLT